MAYPRKKPAKKAVPARRRKAAADSKKKDTLPENVAESLWILLAILGSPKMADEVEAARAAFRRLQPLPKAELRAIGSQIVDALRAIHGLLRRELDSAT